ncbi:hypothetical protein [Frankia sp. QA3]|uniref:hypothetical protein n=1 Tax=Frankia sp. QA3 TaxID=710111 RepID=UPI000269CDE7|nr:hypothetical protein [Frankia sp. QA3]EIV96151.1 hypothetical protein FraQA3DRAFT_6017 [Frankia sp. QA3]
MTPRPRLAATARSHCTCCATRVLREGRCSVRLPADGQVHCLGGTPYQANHGHPQRLADGLVFWSRERPAEDYVFAVEMKGGRVEVDVVLGQLQNGVLVAERICAGQSGVHFAAVLASNSVRSVDLTVLRSRRITFRGRRTGVLKIGCGDSLETLLSRAGGAS